MCSNKDTKNTENSAYGDEGLIEFLNGERAGWENELFIMTSKGTFLNLTAYARSVYPLLTLEK